MRKAADPLTIARDLVRCRSVTPAEGGALGLIATLLAGAGFAVERMTFTQSGTAPVENLYARLGARAPHLVFAGHTDVVPPGEEARWSHPPFAGEIADGRLFGRGAVDMKGGIACALAAVLDYVAAHGGKPAGSLSFLITGDEEGIAVNGTTKLLQWAAARGERFDHCILGEPSGAAAVGDQIKVGRRGSLNGTLTVTGRQGHVAYPQLAENPIRALTALMTALMTEPLDQGSAHFEPSNLEFTSVDVGNPVVNLIPGEARARFNIRFNDCHDQASLKSLVETRAQAAARPLRRVGASTGSPRTPTCSWRSLERSSISWSAPSRRSPAAPPSSPPPAAPRTPASSRTIARCSNWAWWDAPCTRPTNAPRLPTW